MSLKQKSRFIVVTIDGPAGAGKSTLAKMAAEKLNFLFVDTGALYRALTWQALQQKADWTNLKALSALAKNTQLQVQGTGQHPRRLSVWVNGKNVTRWIRSQKVSRHVSTMAALPAVRKILDRLQRQLAKQDHIVMEGRDIGTTIFPQAQFKFYLDASVQERARRRALELQQKGLKVSVAEIEKTIAERDQKDKNRKVSPLRCPPDAIIIDSTHLTQKQVVEQILARCKGLK